MGVGPKLPPQNTQPKTSQSSSKDPDIYAIKPDSYYSSSRNKNKIGLEEESEFDSEEKGPFIFRKKFQIIFALLLLIVIGGIWLFKNYPKIQITVSPNKRELSRELKVVSKLDEEIDIEKQEIPGRVIEVSLEKTLEFESTGESYQGESGRAKGTITIINNYSSAPQVLVATTRFLSSDGKLFRLIKGTTVPGMQADSPGKIQAEIIADKPGEDYNIEPATFTIEGFKGGPKYEKFQATSETKFSGGRTADSGNALVAISENDLKNAREKTIEELEKSIQAELEKELGENEKLLLDSTEKTIESATSSSPANTTVNTFTYTIKETVKTIAFNEEDLKKIASAELVKEINENNTLDNNININYKRGLIDFNNKSLTINLEVKSVAWAKLDLDKIKTGIVGKNEKEIKEFLSNYPGLNQAEIFLIPAQLNKFSTTNQSNITIKEERK